MNQEQALKKLNAARNESEWNAVCDECKRANGGAYPDWWFPAVVSSGIARQAQLWW